MLGRSKEEVRKMEDSEARMQKVCILDMTRRINVKTFKKNFHPKPETRFTIMSKHFCPLNQSSYLCTLHWSSQRLLGQLHCTCVFCVLAVFIITSTFFWLTYLHSSLDFYKWHFYLVSQFFTFSLPQWIWLSSSFQLVMCQLV